MKKIIIAILFLIFPVSLFSQDVKNTSYVTQTGEKVLRLEFVIPVNLDEAWNLFSTAEGWKKWAVPVVAMDFRTGGSIKTDYDTSKTINDSLDIHLGIINYLEKGLLTLKVNLNNAFPPSTLNEDENLQQLIQLESAGDGKTKIISSMIGWGSGPDWDKTYNFFVEGNIWSYQQLVDYFKNKN